MPRWLKALMLTVLLIAGAPAIASAHGGLHDEPAIGAADAPAHAVTTDSTKSAALLSQLYFENSDRTERGECNGLCCCCQGVSRCGSSGGCSMHSANVSAGILNPDFRSSPATWFAAETTVNFDFVFGLERPPRA